MRYLSFTAEGRERWGVLDGDGVVDLTESAYPTLRSRLNAGPLWESPQPGWAAGQRFPLAAIRFRPPITDPGKILCVGLNYREHAREAGMAVPEHPSLFVRFPGSQVAHGQPTVHPGISEQYDYEAELAVVIGRRARHVPAEQALATVAGYSCFADNSVRDWQKHAPQITPGKNFAGSGAFGPWLTTPEEAGPLEALTVIGRLNGVDVQRDSVAGLIFSVPELIAYVSRFAELEPGDVLVTGTPSGVGFLRKPPLYLRPGDRFEVDIPGVGLLSNTVAAEEA